MVVRAITSPTSRRVPPELAGHLFAVSGRLGRVLCRAVEGDGFNVWTANGSAAGQAVFHLHLHAPAVPHGFVRAAISDILPAGDVP